MAPPVSEQQRKLMWSAASKKGGAGGVSQAVGREFAKSDPGGKLPKKKGDSLYDHPTSAKPKGYAEGGKVDPVLTQEELDNYNDAMAESRRQDALDAERQKSGDGKATDGKAKGGKITVVAGKPIGKDDGLIPAQVGEFVVRKSAVKKLGVAALNEINKGRMPSMYDHKTSPKPK